MGWWYWLWDFNHWHKRWPFRVLFCKLGRHDWEFPKIVGDDIDSMCFYCECRKRNIGAARDSTERTVSDEHNV